MDEMPRPAGRREWIGLAVLALPTLLVSMDMSILFLAAPALSAALRPSGSELLWISDIYAFLLAGALIPMGAIGDRIGRRRLLLIGAAFFGFFSVLAAFATGPAMLIGARALLGVAGATLLPSTLALIRTLFETTRQRSVAIGIWTACFTLGGVLGPIAGGVLLEFFWWGSVFLLAVPFMLPLLLLGPRFLPERVERATHPLDWPSVAQSVFGLLSITFALKQLAEHGPTATAALALVAGLMAGAMFLRRQRRLPSPLVDLALFRDTGFSAALAANSLALFAWTGASLLVAQHLQLVVGMSPLNAGLWTVPAAIASVAACLGAASLSRRFSSVKVIGGALALTASGLALMAALSGSFGLPAVISGMVLLGFGVATVMTLGIDLVLAAAPAQKAGAAAAISETSAELGGALGVALLGSIGVAAYRALIVVPEGTAAAAAGAARDTLGGALAIAAGLTATAGDALRLSAQSAFATGFAIAMGVGAVILLAASLLFASTAFGRRSRRQRALAEEA
ncbi:MFS transporter [Variovorax sp. J22P168]|uniref:MFS transporter n=1 Tax=Variovorax jilinensis TaxID=3053513 RepID=UPI002575915E|nr:MFS transporter [Variovorax sp. J22P168]MDM0015623.1 MFS transporter [Variovorax sp. J22P168]